MKVSLRAFTVLIVLAAACAPSAQQGSTSSAAPASSDSPAASATIAAAATGAIASTPTPAPSVALAPEGVNACSLLLWADVASLFPPQDPQPRRGVSTLGGLEANGATYQTGCTYDGAFVLGKGASRAQLSVDCCRTDAEFDAFVKQKASLLRETAAPRAGIGDRAYQLTVVCYIGAPPMATGIAFRKNGWDFEVRIYGVSDWSDSQGQCTPTTTVLPLPAHLSLANIVLGRVSSAVLSTPAPRAVATLPAAASLPTTGRCATPPTVTLPTGFVLNSCRDQDSSVTFAWSGVSSGIALGVLPAAAVVPNPDSTAVDINGNKGTIGPSATTTTLIVWSDAKATYYVSAGGQGLTRDAVLAFARSVR
jgi:hypothetical protein